MEANNVIEFPQDQSIDLDSWVGFIMPEETGELSLEQKRDIYDTFMGEVVLLSEYLAGRQEETGLPDRIFSRALIQLGKSHDQRIDDQIQKDGHDQD